MTPSPSTSSNASKNRLKASDEDSQRLKKQQIIDARRITDTSTVLANLSRNRLDISNDDLQRARKSQDIDINRTTKKLKTTSATAGSSVMSTTKPKSRTPDTIIESKSSILGNETRKSTNKPQNSKTNSVGSHTNTTKMLRNTTGKKEEGRIVSERVKSVEKIAFNNVTSSSNTTKSKRNSIIGNKGDILPKQIKMKDVYKTRLLISREKKSKSVLSSDTRFAHENTETVAKRNFSLATENSSRTRGENETIEEFEYEDDFEDYQSDFESCSESNSSNSLVTETVVDKREQEHENILIEEEKKMDSGSYDVTYYHESQKQKLQLEVIKEALHKENELVQYQLSDSSVSEENASKLKDLLNVENTENSHHNLLLNFNENVTRNFLSAHQRHRNRQISREIKARGEKLLLMITLDVMNYILYDMPSVPYDTFMRCYAREDTSQVYTQTNEDNVPSESQTVKIETKTKWTQHPITVTKNSLNDNVDVLQSLSGVGEELHDDIEEYTPFVDIEKFNKFMKYVGEELIELLEYESMDELNISEENKRNDTEISECVSCIKNSLSFLEGRSVLIVNFDPNNKLRLLTAHTKSLIKTENEFCILCIWNIYQPLKPKMILKSFGTVSCCCFAASNSSYVIAGHDDGSISVWDLRENFAYYKKLILDNSEIVIRSPSFNTANVLKTTEHNMKIINVCAVKENDEEYSYTDDLKIQKIFSIDEENILIMWLLCRNPKKSASLGSAPWSKVEFSVSEIKNISEYVPKRIFRTTIMKVISECRVLIGTNDGFAIRCHLYYKNYKMYKRKFDDVEEKSCVTCIEIYPHDQNYFAAGFSNGDVRVYNLNYSEPILSLKSDNLLPRIISIHWQWNKINCFVSLDPCSGFSVYEFDEQADYSLIKYMRTKKIKSFVASSFVPNSKEPVPHLVFMKSNNDIQIHKFKISNDLFEN